jgi:peptide/nickel transport system ATP-binding protein
MSVLVKATGLVKEFPLKGHLLDIFSKQKKVVHAVDGVDLEIHQGEVLGLAGESGSGKSTTGRLLLRLMDPTKGQVFYRDTDIVTLKPRAMEHMREKMQIVFQDPVSSLSPRMTVGEAIAHPLVIHGSGGDKQWRKGQVLDMMRRVGLQPAEFIYKKYPHQLSGGQSQRVVIARALITNPEFVVADEPIAMADVSVRALILRLMEDLKDDFGLTYLFITHDLATAKYLCDRIAIMYLGRVVEITTRDELFKKPHHPYTRALLAAIPVPDPSVKKAKSLPRGEIPSAVNPPSGCHFHPRCPLATPKCREARPPLREVAPGHFSACILD